MYEREKKKGKDQDAILWTTSSNTEKRTGGWSNQCGTN